MTHLRMIDRLTKLIGSDVAVTFDDQEAPTSVVIYRHDPITEPLVRSAIVSLREEFPEELRSLSAVLVAFEGDLGPTRRRVVVD